MLGKRTGLLLVLILILTGCSAATQEGPDAPEVSLNVQNDIMPPVAFSIFARDNTGSRRMIGLVRPGENTTLRFDARGAGDFTFIAEGPLGREIISDEMTLGSGDTAVWSLNNNVLTPF